MTAHINAGHPNRVIRTNKREEPDSISPCGRTTNMGDASFSCVSGGFVGDADSRRFSLRSFSRPALRSRGSASILLAGETAYPQSVDREHSTRVGLARESCVVKICAGGGDE